MVRLFKLLLAVALFGGTAGVAHAQTAPWTVSEVSGRVTIRDASGVATATRGATVDPGEVLETGPSSRAVVVRGKDFVTIAPSSRIRIPTAQTQGAGLFDVLQEWGNAIFQIEKKPNPHFGVRTPYLAAVVKGTTFSITVADDGASLQVTEGAVETSTMDGGARDLIRPGFVAVVAASDRYRLTVQGQETKVIDSPQRPATGEVSSEGPSVAGPDDSTGTGGTESGSSAVGVVSEVAPTVPSFDNQVILEALAPEPVNLSEVTGGLVAGSTSNQVAAVVVASRDEGRDGGPAPQPGAGNGSAPGDGNGNSGNGNSGNGNGSSGNGNGNGNGNSGNGNSGNGNGNSGNGNSGSGNGNSGSGNGNGNSGNGNSGNGNGNSGSGNGNGNGNGNSGNGDSGNGNGNSGNGNGNSGSGNGNGNSGNGNGNGNSGNGNSGNGNGNSGNGNGNSGSGNGNGNSGNGNGNGNSGNGNSGNGNGNSGNGNSGNGNGNSGSGNGNSGNGNSGSGNGNSGNGNGSGSGNGNGNGNSGNGSGNGNSGNGN